jgi:RNA polymerase sigma factor (sigma-70 family)
MEALARAPHQRARVSPLLSTEDVDATALVAAIAGRRDRAAFARLFQLYAPRVKGQLMARGASAAVADELTQEVMLTVWRKAEQFDRGKGLVSTWLYAITRNCFINHVRRAHWPEPEPEPERAAAAPAPDEQLAAASEAHRLREAMRELPTEQREVLVGAYDRGRSLSELANEQGIPLGTVKTRVRLAMARLRERLVGKVDPK